jgi:cell division protein FtsL
MYRLKDRTGRSKAVPAKPILAAKRRRQLHPFFFSMGPVALSISSVLLVSLMAVLYLSQLGQAVTANQNLQDIHTQQAILERQNQDLVNVIAQEQSPEYIAAQARALGLVPSDPKNVQVLIVKHLELMHNYEPGIQP